MGDGEATASAVECALDATFRLTISDDFHVTRPVVAAETEVMTTGEGATMEEASNGALNAMAELMVERLAIGLYRCRHADCQRRRRAHRFGR